jgi:hypothetical protein
VSTVLGRVTSSTDQPRGPDAKYRVRVAENWLKAGAKIEVKLPRNLECAACDGGGCDACGGSGALTLRGREDPSEYIQVTLPQVKVPPKSGKRGMILRIPESGGYASGETELPRGLLLLSLIPDAESDHNVRLWLEGGANRTMPPPPPQPRRALGRYPGVAVVAVLVLLWIALLVFLRVSGFG